MVVYDLNVLPSSTVTIAPFAVVSSFRVHLTAEQVEAIAHVQHGITIDAVVLRIAAPRCAHPSLKVALLSEQVVKVERYDECLALEERLGYLSVPYQFIGVRGRIVVTASTMFAKVSAYLESSR